MTAITTEQQRALTVARELVGLGVPLFLAPADPHHWSGTGYALPAGWQRSTPDPQVVDAWRPGMALCLVTGHGLDLIDIDPRSGGSVPAEYLPPVLAWSQTPSGGVHGFVLGLEVASRDGVFSGVDVKAGLPDGSGRGFAFLAPTVRKSKVDGQFREYMWTSVNTGRIRDAMNWTRTHGNPGGQALRNHIATLRAPRRATDRPRRVPMSVARNEWDRACAKLVTDIQHWAATGWGGHAHAGLLAASTHLARLAPEHAVNACLAAFRSAGVEPDGGDLQKIHSAVARAVPDQVVPDHEMSPHERFWVGAPIPEAASRPPGADVPDPRDAGLGHSPPAGFTFAPVTRERYTNRKPPRDPVLGHFGGEHGLFYDEGVHWLQGESESGKTWVALGLVAEVLRAGGTACVVDYEDTEDNVLGRLAVLGVPEDDIVRLVYVPGTDVAFGELAEHVARVTYDVMVIDGVTTAMSAAGCSDKDGQETTAWTNALPRRARMAVCVDHVVKAVDERRGMATGSQAKKSVVTGSAWEVVCPPKGKFGRGKSGFLLLYCQKDKPGGMRGRGWAPDRALRLGVLVDAVTGAVRLAAPTPREVERTEVQEASAVAERYAAAERLFAWMSEAFSPGTSQRTVIADAKAKHPRAPRDTLVLPVYRVWCAITGGINAASPDDPEELRWYKLWSDQGKQPELGSQPTRARDLEKPAAHSPGAGQTHNASIVDSVEWVQGVDTSPNTNGTHSMVDLQ